MKWLISLVVNRLLGFIVDLITDWIEYQRQKKKLKKKIKEIKQSGKSPQKIAADINNMLS